MKKRFLAILLALAMMVSLLAFPVSAESSVTSASGVYNGMTWELADGTLTISGTGDMCDFGDVSLSDHPWWKYRDSITAVVVEEGITSIGEAAFYEMYNLTSVSLSSNITSIGSSAFQLCSSLTKVVIPSGVTEISSYAFCQCTSLVSITIPSSMESIGYWAFYMCDSLTSVNYLGTSDMWQILKSNIDEGNESLTEAQITCRGQAYYGVQNTAADEDEDLLNLIQEYMNDWYAAYTAYTDAVYAALEDAASSADDEDTREQVIASEAASMQASDEAGTTSERYITIVYPNDEYEEAVQDAVYEAYATFLYDKIASCEEIDLSSISATDANSTKLLTKVINSLIRESETYEIGKVTVKIVASGISGAFYADITVTYKGESCTGITVSSQATIQSALTNFINEMIGLEGTALFQVYKGLYTDILGTSIEKLTTKYLSQKLTDSVLEKLPSGIGDLAGDLTYCYDYWKLASKAMSTLESGRDTSELEAIYQSMSSIKFEDKGISTWLVKQAWKKLTKAAENLTDAYGSYCAGTLETSRISTWWNNKTASWSETWANIKAAITCPVNVAVYDSAGAMIGYAGEDDTWYTEDFCYIEEDGEAVIIYIFTDDEVTFDVEATGYGTVSCSFETYDDDGTPVGRTNYYDIVVETGQTITASVTGEDGVSGCSVVMEGNVITADEYVSAEDDASVTITCEIEGSGEVTGTGTYVRGDAVVLSATPDDDYVFVAWYDGDEIISTDRMCEFTAEEDAEITAIFRCSEVTRDIVLVLDVSNSMSGDKLTNTKTAAKAFVNQILSTGSNIQIAIVTYNSSYATVCDLTSDQDTLLEVIDSLSASGNTNMYGGLSTAGSILSSSTAEKKAIVIMTDGVANTGTTSSASYVTTEEGDYIYFTKYGKAIYNLANTYKSDDYGYTIYSLGFGLTEGSDAYNLIKYIASLDEDGNRYFWSVTNDNVDDLVFTYTDIADTVTVTEKSIKIVIECPVDASVTLDEETLDRNNLTASFGSLTVTEVSDGYQYIFLLEDNPDYDLQIVGIGSGFMDITIYYYSDDDFEYRAFENIPISVSSVITSNGTDRDEEFVLLLDSDGDGTADESWSANENEIITLDLPTYTLYLYSGGDILETMTKTYGDTVEIDSLTEPTQTGYTFAGWTDADGNPVTENITVTCDITLFANWTINTYTLSLYNGEELISKETVTYGDTVEIDSLTEPTQTGYTFAGWTDADGNPVTENITVTGDITLYANWTQTPNLDRIIGNNNSGVGDDELGSTEDSTSDTDTSGADVSDDSEVETSDTTDVDSGTGTDAEDMTGNGSPFTDDNSTGTWLWASDYIYECYAVGILTGYEDGSYLPDSSLTRAEAAAIIARAYGLTSDAEESTFSDVSSTHWGLQYIEACVEAGIINGYEDGTFKPDQYVTRVELAKMIAVAEQLALDAAESSFSDVSADHWGLQYIEACVEAGIVNGYTDGTFLPANNVTRAEAAAMIARALGLAE